MNIVKVSLSGANERLPQKDVIEFLKTHPMAEINVAVSKEYGLYGTPRFKYVKSLMEEYQDCYAPGQTGTMGLMVNGSGQDGLNGWPSKVSVGSFPYALIMMAHYPDVRLQLCHLGYVFPPRYASLLLHSRDLREVITPCPRLVLPYGAYTMNYVNKFVAYATRENNTSLKYDVLYDASFAICDQTNRYRPQRYNGIRQGYTGGFGIANIKTELAKIDAAQVNPDAEIWINAKGKLRNPNLKTLDLDRADIFYEKVMAYRATHTK